MRRRPAIITGLALMGMETRSVLQRGQSFDVYNQPSCRFVAEFMGAGNLLQGKVINSHQITTPIGVVESSTKVCTQSETAVELFIRPQMLTVEKCVTSLINLPAKWSARLS